MTVDAVPFDTVMRERALQDYRKKLCDHKEVESKLKESEVMFRVYFDSSLSNFPGYC